jgi:hypothetical protein
VTEADLIFRYKKCPRYVVCKKVIRVNGFASEAANDFLEMDNKGAVDLVNNYSVGGKTRRMETRQYY